MKLMFTAALCAALMAPAMMARAEGDVALNDADVQRLLGPTLRSVQVEASSNNGFVSLTLPGGQVMRQSLSLPRFTIPVDILPDIECDIQPMRNAGSPTFNYRDGWFRFLISLRPVSGNLIARTNSFYPNVTAPRVDIEMRFRLESRGGTLGLSEFQTSTTGAIDLTGAGAPFSPLVRERIQRAISTNVEAQLRPRLSLLVGLVLPAYLQQLTGYGDTLHIGAVTHTRDQVLFNVTGRVQRPPVQFPTVDLATSISPGVLTKLIQQSDNDASTSTKKVKDDEKAQALLDKQLAEKYSTNKAKGAGGGAGKSDKG